MHISDINKSGVDLNNARKKEQIETMKKIVADGGCPFCHDFIDKEKPTYHSNPVLMETDFWVATRNAWPYEYTREHLIFVIKRHILLPEEMKNEEILDLWNIIKKIKKELRITHSTFLMRSDSTGMTGATVQHLHAQLVVADGKEPVITRIG